MKLIFQSKIFFSSKVNNEKELYILVEEERTRNIAYKRGSH